MTIYHKHHIIPKHMGGTDDPGNLIELTVEQHAEAHRLLYETYGFEQDKLAWQGLLGIIPKEDIVKVGYKIGQAKTTLILKEKYGVTNPGQLPESRKKASERMKKRHEKGLVKIPNWTGKKHKQETKDKIGKKLSIAQEGFKNSQFGTMWITNGTENKKVKKTVDFIPKGWYKGRTQSAESKKTQFRKK